MTIRVTRVLQYEYPDVDTMLQDQQRWTLQSAPGSPVKMRQLGYLMDMDRQPLDPAKMRGIHPEPEWQGYEPTAIIVDELAENQDIRFAHEWESQFGFTVIDPDGWRNEGLDYIGWQGDAREFLRLCGHCTLRRLDKYADARALYGMT